MLFIVFASTKGSLSKTQACFVLLFCL